MNSPDYRTLFPDPLDDQGSLSSDQEGTGKGHQTASGDAVREATRTDRTRPSSEASTDMNSDVKEEFSKTLASDRASSAEELATCEKQLVDLGLVTLPAWKVALKRGGPTPSLMGILKQFTETESKFDASTGNRLPVLTQFQVRQILNGNAERLRFPNHIILDKLGAGGMGEVFIARNLKLPRLEAIKTILCEGADLSSSGSSADKSKARERFNREASLLARLNHPNLPTVFDHDIANGVAYIAMEYVDGRDIGSYVKDSIKSRTPLAVEWCVEKIIDVADALHHAHENKVVHRDIKPSNIMLTRIGERVKLLDLGIGKLLTAANEAESGGAQATMLTQTGGPMGTPHFMPPEQWADATSVTPASDIYSLGCTLYYMLTGLVPFNEDHIQKLFFAHMEAARPKASAKRPGVPKKLDEIIMKMMAPKPEQRYQSAAVMIADLRKVIRPEQAPVKKSNVVVMSGIAAGAAVVLAGVLFFVFKPEAPVGAQDVDRLLAQVSSEPDNAALRIQLAQALLGRNLDGDAELVIENASRALDSSSNPSEKAQAYVFRGRASAARKDLVAAAKDFFLAAAAQPQDPAIKLEAAQAAVAAAGQLSADPKTVVEIIPLFEAASKAGIVDAAFSRYAAQAYAERGSQELAKSDFKAAHADFELAVKADDRVAKSYSLRGDALVGLGQFEQAIADYSRAEELAAGEERTQVRDRVVVAQLRWGDSFAKAQAPDFQQAVNHYALALDGSPAPEQRAEILRKRAAAYHEQKQFKEAIADLSALLSGPNPTEDDVKQATETVARRALDLDPSKQSDELIDLFEKAESMKAADNRSLQDAAADAYLFKARSLIGAKEYTQATAGLRRAQSLKKSLDAVVHAESGRILLARADFRGAAREFDEAIKEFRVQGSDQQVRQYADDAARAQVGLARGELASDAAAAIDRARKVLATDVAADVKSDAYALIAQGYDPKRNSAELIANYEAAQAQNLVSPEHAKRAAAAFAARAQSQSGGMNLDAPLKDLQTAIGLDANYAPARTLRGDLLAKQGAFDQAVKEYNAALGVDGLAAADRAECVQKLAAAYIAWGKKDLGESPDKSKENAVLALELDIPADLKTQAEKLQSDAEEALKRGMAARSVGDRKKRVKTLLEEKKYEGAIFELARLVESDPDRAKEYRTQIAQAALPLGRQLVQDKKYEEAVSSLKAAIDDPATQAEALKTTASAQVELGKIEAGNPARAREAIAIFSDALKSDPQSAEAHLQRAVVEARIGRADDAKADFEAGNKLDSAKAVLLRSGIGKATADFGDQLLRNQDLNGAVIQYETAKSWDPQSAKEYEAKAGKVHAKLADLAFKNAADYATAKSKYELAIKLDPASLKEYQAALAPVLVKVAGVDARRGDFDGALASYKQAVELDAENAALKKEVVGELYAHGATLYNTWLRALNNRQNDTASFDRAIKILTECTKLDNSHVNAYRYMSILYSTAGSLDKAYAPAVEIIRIDPDGASSADAYRISGVVRVKGFIERLSRGEKDENALKQAITHLEKAASLYPKNNAAYNRWRADVLSNLAGALAYDQQAARGIEFGKEAVSVAPAANKWEAYLNLSAAYFANGQKDEAVRNAQEALRVAPENQKPGIQATLNQYQQ